MANFTGSADSLFMAELMQDPGKVQARCGDLGSAGCAASNFVIGLALSGLTGVRASIPIFIVALGSKISDKFPLVLAGESDWLDSWPAIILLGMFVVLEVVGDLVPGADHVIDTIMLVLKPVVGIVLSVAPYYGQPGFQVLVMKALGASLGALLALLVAVVKAVQTAAVNAATGFLCGWARSVIENMVTLLSVMLIVFVGLIMAIIVLVCVVSAVAYWVTKRRREGKPVLPRRLWRLLNPRSEAARESRPAGALPQDLEWPEATEAPTAPTALTRAELGQHVAVTGVATSVAAEKVAAVGVVALPPGAVVVPFAPAAEGGSAEARSPLMSTSPK